MELRWQNTVEYAEYTMHSVYAIYMDVKMMYK